MDLRHHEPIGPNGDDHPAHAARLIWVFVATHMSPGHPVDKCAICIVGNFGRAPDRDVVPRIFGIGHAHTDARVRPEIPDFLCSLWAADPQFVLVDHDSYRYHRQVPVRAGGRHISDPQGAVQKLADLLRYRHGIVHASCHVLLHSSVVDRITLFDPAGGISLT